MYDHAVHDIRVVETHISWIILTGPYAYKIKKPVSLGFLDFSTLRRRKTMCVEELRVNRRLAPDLYIAVIAITGNVKNPILSGAGEVIEYAVKMVQFDSDKEMDVLIKGKLDIHLIDDLALQVADFHQHQAHICVEQDFSSSIQVSRRIKDNFADIRPSVDAAARQDLDLLEEWVDAGLSNCRNLIDARKRDGYVRECHGDLHLGNMVLIGDRIRLFDCLEFNEQYRWIDVMSEIAFVVMDFDFHHHRNFGFQFLNRYLWVTGDYAGLELLPLYLVYRAMVRAKVASIQRRQSVTDSSENKDLSGYLKLAQSYIALPPARLFITHGYSGSGKSWWAERIARLLPAIHIRSDVERSRSQGVGGELQPAAGRYDTRAITRNYEWLRNLAENIIRAGYSVIVDATFLQYGHREKFYTMARQAGAVVYILDFKCEDAVLRARIGQRVTRGTDPSEATVAVLDEQIKHAQPLRAEESGITVAIRTDREQDAGGLVDRIVSL